MKGSVDMPRGEKSFGNNYGKNNKGKKYNNIHYQTNGRVKDNRCIRISAFVNLNGDICNVCAYQNNGDCWDFEGLPDRLKKHWDKWGGTVVQFYHNNKPMYYNIIKTPNATETKIIRKDY